MAILINTTHPQLRILVPETGEYVSFVGGKLEIDDDEPGYEAAMAEAVRNPLISIMVNETTCQFCGEVFAGKSAKAQLGTHKKANHFDLWEKEKDIEQASARAREVKARAGYACDVCQPTQTFGTPGDLAEHVKLLHTTPPETDADGNEIAVKGRPGEVEPVAAAARSRRS